MKIVKKGKPGTKWVGKKIECSSCRCIFKLENGYNVEFVSEQRDGDFYKVKCHGCQGLVTFTKIAFRN